MHRFVCRYVHTAVQRALRRDVPRRPGGRGVWSAVDLGRSPTPQRAMRVFGVSITYITVLFGAILVDVLVRFGP